MTASLPDVDDWGFSQECWALLKSDYNFFLAAVRPQIDPDDLLPEDIFLSMADDFYKFLTDKWDGPSTATN